MIWQSKHGVLYIKKYPFKYKNKVSTEQILVMKERYSYKYMIKEKTEPDQNSCLHCGATIKLHLCANVRWTSATLVLPMCIPQTHI